MVEVTLPSLGESVTEGTITQWFKRVGDLVARDEPLFEVSTDKVDSEMPSPAAGVLTEILAGEGDTVTTGARVAVIDETQTVAVAPSPAATPAPPSGEPAPEVVPSGRAPVTLRPDETVGGVVLSPVVRRILADGGVAPSSVAGSGPGGTITRRDAERAVALGPTEEVAVALSLGQRRMGQHLTFSAQVCPQGFVAIEVDGSVVARLDALGRTTREGVPVADETVVALAAVRALGEFEFLNASLEGDRLVLHQSVNLGLVRPLVDEGMLVPVVHAAAGLTLRALARRVADLDERLVARELTADDLMGGTFTVAAAPSPHALLTQPIVIQPEVAALSIGAVREVPVVVEGALAVGHRLVLGLSFDHRVCESTAAARYLERVAELLGGLDLESER